MVSVTSDNGTSAAAADGGLLNDDTTLTSTSVMNTNAERFMALSTMRARPKRADLLLRRGHVSQGTDQSSPGRQVPEKQSDAPVGGGVLSDNRPSAWRRADGDSPV